MKAQFKPRRGRKPDGCWIRISAITLDERENAQAKRRFTTEKLCQTLSRDSLGRTRTPPERKLLAQVTITLRSCARRMAPEPLIRMGIPVQNLHIGMKVRHPRYGVGMIKSLTEHTADITFDDAPRTV